MRKHHLRTPGSKSGKRFKAKEITTAPTTTEYPSFSFRYCCVNRYHVDHCDDPDKIALIRRIAKLSTMQWNQILLADRHGLGSEKIEQDIIRAQLPGHITKDTTLLALRFSNMKPMVGYRDGGIFYILFLDHDFSLYPH